MRIVAYTRLAILFFRLVKNPQRTELIFTALEIANKFKDDPFAKSLISEIMERNEFRDLFEQRYLPPWPTLNELASMPAQSFGRALHAHLMKNGLDLELFPRLEPHDEIDYLNARAYQDHDLWHALLGYSTSLEDELALQAFGVAQFKGPLGSFLIAGGILHLMLRTPARAPQAIKKIAEGYSLGERCRFFLGMRLVDLLPRPLEEVRRLANVPPLLSA